MTDKMY